MRSHAIKGLEAFALARAADDDSAFDLVEVEDVGRLAHGEPGEIGGVNGIGDFLLLKKLKKVETGVSGNQSRDSAMVTSRSTRAVNRPQASWASMRTGKGTAAGFGSG